MGDTAIGILGAAGRMGKNLIKATIETPGCTLAGAIERLGADAVGTDAGTLAGVGPFGVAVGDDPGPLFDTADVVIDFTAVAAVPVHADLAVRSGTALVVGTTGLEEPQFEALRRAGEAVPVVWASNMSLGVNLLIALTRQVAAALGPDYDIEVLEMHHRNKVDAPSGTALSLGMAAAEGRGVALDSVWTKVRDGHTGARQSGSIGFATLRGGDVIGDHTVMYAGLGERVELTHKASDRGIYARGAVRAAQWTSGRAPGFYGMADVLGV